MAKKRKLDADNTVFFSMAEKDGSEYFFTQADGEVFDKLSRIKPGDYLYIRIGTNKKDKKYASFRFVEDKKGKSSKDDDEDF